MEEERDNRRRYNNSQRQNNRDYQRDNNKDIPQNQEEKVPENTDKDTLVNLNVNTEKSEKKINLSNLKIDQLHLALYEVNGMIVDFYDKTLAELGSQGVLDDSGRPMDPANFSTPEEKFKALTSVLSIQHSFGNNLDKVMNIAKSKKEQLKERAIKILDGEQELIDENNKLIESAKYKIGELKNEKTALDNKRTEEMRNLEAEERKKISLKNLCDEITEKIEVLKEQINNPPADLIQANSQNQKGRGNQNALSEYIKGLNEQIKFQQGEFANYSNDLSNCEKNAQKMMANADNLEKQSISMQEKIDISRII